MRRAALIAGLALLVMTIAAPIAEIVVYPRIIVSGHIEATVQNILAKRGLALVGLFCYLITFILDLVVAWALYMLLAPVNRAMSLLAAWFRLLYTALAFAAFMNVVDAFRLVHLPEYPSLVGPEHLHAQVAMMLKSFRYEWGMSLILFGIHLVLVGWLVYRSGYIPRFLAIPLVIAGCGWIVFELGPFLYPDANLGFVMITFFGELVFLGWLLTKGWRIQELAASGSPED